MRERTLWTWGRAIVGACALTTVLAACHGSRSRCAFVDRGDASSSTVVAGACEELACPTGARPDGTGRCVCDGETWPLLGACVSREIGEAFCGAAASFEGGACKPLACPADSLLDAKGGRCVPRSLADTQSHAKLEEDEHVECAGTDRALVMSDRGALCAPRGRLCGRDVRSDSCEPASCAAGEVWDELARRCVRVVRSDGHGAGVLDVGAWARAAIGPDGGPGARALCGPLALAGAQPLVAGRVDLRVDLSFPNNDVSMVVPELTVRAEEPRAVPLPIVTQALVSSVEVLRRVGGTATSATVSVHVVCDLAPIEGATIARSADSGLR